MSEGGRPIRTVVFDFGQTLVDMADGFRAAEKAAQGRLCADLDPACAESFLARYREIRAEFHQNAVFSRTAMWRAVYEHYRRQADLRVLEEWEREYWERAESSTRVFPEAERVLRELGVEYRLGLVTNTRGRSGSTVSHVSRFPELERRFDSIVIAGEGGVPPKPHPEPFHLCLKRLGVPAADAAYVGDDWRIDMCGAREAGLRPIWLKHHLVQRNWPEGDGTMPVIDSLDSLLEMASVFQGAAEPSSSELGTAG